MKLLDGNIILCGFMGSGKSTVGRLLAKKTGLLLIDTDKFIEQEAGTTIAEIFRVSGETYFRDLEHQVVASLSQTTGKLISVGGGTLLDKRNVDILKKSGKIVLLDASLPKIMNRLEGDTTRPLLNQPNRNETITRLFSARMPTYRAAADFTIDADASLDDVCEEIMKTFDLY